MDTCGREMEWFGVEVNCKHISKLLRIPKLHKVSYTSRFITGAKHYTTKQLPILVNDVLNVMRAYFKKYCENIYNVLGTNYFCS